MKPEFKQADLNYITEAHDSDWVAICGVCEGSFCVREEDSFENPAPNGSFCPDCKETKLMAPGVLHWKKRK